VESEFKVLEKDLTTSESYHVYVLPQLTAFYYRQGKSRWLRSEDLAPHLSQNTCNKAERSRERAKLPKHAVERHGPAQHRFHANGKPNTAQISSKAGPSNILEHKLRQRGPFVGHER
jgi:hypothetical protein